MTKKNITSDSMVLKSENSPCAETLPGTRDQHEHHGHPAQPGVQQVQHQLAQYRHNHHRINKLKSGLPGGLPSDPRTWSRDDVGQFLQYCEREFDLEKIDMEKFQMNGKALCFLSKNDLAERCSGAGDVIHNILQMLLRESSCFTPSPPITPRPPGLMTPTSPSPFGTPHWPLLNSSASETFPNLSHLISQTNSVTLSPAPSLDSTSGGSPKQEVLCLDRRLHPG